MTWTELALKAGCETEDQAEYFLWNRTAFPFARPRTVYYQLRHALRHTDPACQEIEARCQGRKCRPKRVHSLAESGYASVGHGKGIEV